MIKVLSHVKIRQEDDAAVIERQREEERAKEKLNYQHQGFSAMAKGEAKRPEQAEGEAPSAPKERQNPLRREHPKVGRNEPCPCGSGKKYKSCHGRIN